MLEPFHFPRYAIGAMPYSVPWRPFKIFNLNATIVPGSVPISRNGFLRQSIAEPKVPSQA
jgi:hypothetical protein